MIKYRGGKSKEISNIMWHIPRFTGRYIEPFFGGGALFFYLEPRQAIINDINAKLMKFYRGVRDDYSNLRRELDEIELLYTNNRNEFDALKALHPDERVEDKNEEFYYLLRAMFNETMDKSYSDALLYYYINKTAYSGMIRYNAKGEFNVPFGRYTHLNTKSVTLSHSKLLQRAEILNTDYNDVFNMCRDDDFVFLDPPYDCIFSDCKTLMVIGRTPLTEELYKGYIVDEYEKNYAVNIRNRFKAAAKHIVVANYRKCWDNIRVCSSQYAVYNEPKTAQLRLFEARQPYGTNR